MAKIKTVGFWLKHVREDIDNFDDISPAYDYLKLFLSQQKYTQILLGSKNLEPKILKIVIGNSLGRILNKDVADRELYDIKNVLKILHKYVIDISFLADPQFYTLEALYQIRNSATCQTLIRRWKKLIIPVVNQVLIEQQAELNFSFPMKKKRSNKGSKKKKSERKGSRKRSPKRSRKGSKKRSLKRSLKRSKSK